MEFEKDFKEDWLNLSAGDCIYIFDHPLFDIPAETLPILIGVGGELWSRGTKYVVTDVLNMNEAVSMDLIDPEDFKDEWEEVSFGGVHWTPVVVCSWSEWDREQTLRDIRIKKILGE